MFKKISSWFSEDKKENIKEEPIQENITPEAVELPDVIKIPWEKASRLKNIEYAKNKIHQDLKDFYYNNKLTERKTFSLLEELDEKYQEIEDEIKQAYEIPEDADYILEPPAANGRPAFLKKKESK